MTRLHDQTIDHHPDRRRWLKAGLSALAVGATASWARRADAQTAQRGLIRTVRSPFYEALKNRALRCTLCPRRCRLAEGQRGPCRVRENRGGECISLVYGNPCIVQDDPVERKPFYHVLPGTRALSVATAGCNMTCKFCEVWDTALVDPEDVFAYALSPDDIMAQVQAANLPSVAYTFGEPVIFFEYMTSIARRAHDGGIKNLLHTNAYISEKPLKALIPFLDAVNVDLKSFRPDIYRDICGGELEPVLDNLKTLRRAGMHLEITCLVIPTITRREDDIEAMSRWIRDELGAHTPLHLARFYPLYQLKNLPPTPVSQLDEARDIARASGLEYVYISKVPGHEGEDTLCPGCGERIITRMGFILESMALRDGKCKHCGRAIPGVWS